MTTPPDPARSGCAPRPAAVPYSASSGAAPQGPHHATRTMPPLPSYPGNPRPAGDQSTGGPEARLVPGDSGRAPHEDLRRRGRVHLAKWQRGIDATAVGQLLLCLPSSLASLGIVAVLSSALLPAMEWAGILMWIASGAMAFHRPTERAVARHLLKLRHPTPRERTRLEPLWREVSARAGVEGRAYELWIEDSDHLNALAAAGHIVGVTRFSLNHLADDQMAAVLAHELGHHVRGHAWSSLLGQWYALPGRLAWSAVRRLVRLVALLRPGRTGCATAALLLVVGICLALIVLSFWFIALALVVAPYLLAAVARRAELRADRHAAAAGFGPPLAEVLHMMHTAEAASERATAPALSGCGRTAAADKGTSAHSREQSFSGRLLSSHPDYFTRLHHLAPYLNGR